MLSCSLSIFSVFSTLTLSLNTFVDIKWTIDLPYQSHALDVEDVPIVPLKTEALLVVPVASIFWMFTLIIKNKVMATTMCNRIILTR